jgi:hypothetical protein
MSNESIKKRLAALKSQIEPETCFCLVELPDGTEAEKSMDEWFEHRREWRWKRMTRGGDNAAVLLLLAAINDEVAEDAMEKGDTAAAARLTAESAQFLAQYERRASG